MSTTPTFDLLASQMTAGMLMERADADRRVAEADLLAENPTDVDAQRPATLVVREGQVIGQTSARLWGEERIRVAPILPDQIVAASADYLTLLQCIATERYVDYFVLDGNQIVGILNCQDVLKPAGQLCLLGLVLDLERAVEEFCLTFPERCWSLVKEQRRETLMSIYRKRGHPLPPWDPTTGTFAYHMIRNAAITDKATMLIGSEVLTGISTKDLRAAFDTAKRVRDSAAHPRNSREFFSEAPSNHLYAFYQGCQRIIAEIDAAVRTAGERMPLRPALLKMRRFLDAQERSRHELRRIPIPEVQQAAKMAAKVTEMLASYIRNAEEQMLRAEAAGYDDTKPKEGAE